MKYVWGEIMKKIVLIAVLALAIVAVPVMAQNMAAVGGRGTDILGNGIIESGDGAFKFPLLTDTNFDSMTVGNDNARAIAWQTDFPFIIGPAKAENNLEIKKNQQVGPCKCCDKEHRCDTCNADASLYGDHRSECQDCCTTVNIDQVHVGNRNADAFGLSSAVNDVKLVLNQAP